MSQSGSLNTGGGGGGSTLTQFTTDVDSPTIPSAGVVAIFGVSSQDDYDPGIETIGSGGLNFIEIALTNRLTGAAATAEAATSTIITFSLGATPGTYYVYGNVQSFDSTTPTGGGYSFSGAYRTDGAAGTDLGSMIHDQFEDAALLLSDITLSVVGNNVILEVTGVVGINLNWNALLEYRRAV